MSNQQKEKTDLKEFEGRVFVWISKEDRRIADEFLLKQKMGSSKKLKKKGTKQKPVFICDYCQKEFPKSSKLKRHVKIHRGQKGFHCNLCDYSCSQKGNLQTHIRRHLKERPFKCQEPNCGAGFATSWELKSHQLVHNKRDKKFSCARCPFKTHVKSNGATSLSKFFWGNAILDCDVNR